MPQNDAMSEHPFAEYIRILGRGKKGARSLTFDEARSAMTMILANEVEPVQLGAFLMLMRVKEESPEELAGFVKAAREILSLEGRLLPRAMVDWSTYAGKRRQLPWYILAALLLAENGVTILMHGTHGHKDDRVYAPEVVEHLGLPLCQDFSQVEEQIGTRRFAFIELEQFCPKLKQILDLRGKFGLRSPINTLLRMINPLSAPYLMQGIFHPGYRDIHQQAALLLGQPHMVVFKGEGGETERNPDTECKILTVDDGVAHEETWPAMFTRRHLRNEHMAIEHLCAVWRDEIEDEYGVGAVTGTAAIGLRLLGRASNGPGAERLASEMWAARPRDRFAARLPNAGA